MSAPWLDRILDRVHGVLDREARVVRASVTEDTSSTKVKAYVQAMVARAVAEHVASTAGAEVRLRSAALTGGQRAEALACLVKLGVAP
jgi:hypothetical protein